jgi:uracil-DNA glycosylase family 4
MRTELRKLYAAIMVEAEFADLRKSHPPFVPGEGCEWYPMMVLVGEAPGATEEEQRRPFVGASGQLLRRAMGQAGFDTDTCFITNVVKYRPDRNRPPTPSEVAAARPYLLRELAILSGEVVVPLGRHAFQALLPEETRTITAVHGKLIQRGIRSYYPLIHPSAALRSGLSVAQYAEVFHRLREILG